MTAKNDDLHPKVKKKSPMKEDCLECRLTGALTCFGISAYSFVQVRNTCDSYFCILLHTILIYLFLYIENECST